ncbi:MAG: hypothetical protein ACFHX7_05495 [Pseudomonadota bacterium]
MSEPTDKQDAEQREEEQREEERRKAEERRVAIRDRRDSDRIAVGSADRRQESDRRNDN